MTDKQTILIAGANGNIGGGTAVALAKRGTRVVLIGRSPDRLRARVDIIRAALCEARMIFKYNYQYHEFGSSVSRALSLLS